MTDPQATAAVKPFPPVLYRWAVMVIISLAMFGNYYVYDSIAPIADRQVHDCLWWYLCGRGRAQRNLLRTVRHVDSSCASRYRLRAADCGNHHRACEVVQGQRAEFRVRAQPNDCPTWVRGGRQLS